MKPVVHLIAAARPNFMKVAPLYHQLRKTGDFHPVLVHTGQHYDLNMSDCFFQDLRLPEPDVHLGAGSGTHAEQTAKVLTAYEKELLRSRPDCVIVVGDVNSTMACTLAASKLQIPIAHLEAGLRSFDRTMPEEINRLVTDSIADLLWPPSQDGVDNLLKEGVDAERITLVGNIMIDSFEMMKDAIDQERYHEAIGVTPNEYGVVTLHRPSNVDQPERLRMTIDKLIELSEKLKLVFPLHPRTVNQLKRNNLLDKLRAAKGIQSLDSTSYIRFMSLVGSSKLVVTDSGGIQEETSYMGIPCLTLRDNTERPITVTNGTNILVTPEELEARFMAALKQGRKDITIPLWDGRTAQRVEDSLKEFLL